MRKKLQGFVENVWFTNTVIALIILNAIVLGVEATATGDLLAALLIVDQFFVAIFAVEILLKLYAYRLSFFRSGWNTFDFTIVAISLVPASGPLSVLRALRILRVLRLISQVPSLRRVADAFLHSLSGLSAVLAILLIIFYAGAVMAVKFFGQEFPQWFGSVGGAMYSLFQIMTLESWSMGIVRPVMEVYPYAWTFFVPFILLTTFAVLNLVIGIIVNSMQVIHDKEQEVLESHLSKQDRDAARIVKKVEKLEALLDDLKKEIKR